MDFKDGVIGLHTRCSNTIDMGIFREPSGKGIRSGDFLYPNATIGEKHGGYIANRILFVGGLVRGCVRKGAENSMLNGQYSLRQMSGAG